MKNTDTNNILDKVVADMNGATELIENLHTLGYNFNFEMSGSQLVCYQNKCCYPIRDFHIDEVFRFVHESRIPGYFLFALQHNTYTSLKGIFTVYPIATREN